jgi:hypothetical protein
MYPLQGESIFAIGRFAHALYRPDLNQVVEGQVKLAHPPDVGEQVQLPAAKFWLRSDTR